MDHRKIAILAAAVALGSCSPKPDDSICEPVPTYPRDKITECTHFWAYRLAGSPDPAEVVAKAVAQGCALVADSEAKRNARSADGRLDENRRQAILKQNMEVVEKNALFRVVEARAGNCHP